MTTPITLNLLLLLPLKTNRTKQLKEKAKLGPFFLRRIIPFPSSTSFPLHCSIFFLPSFSACFYHSGLATFLHFLLFFKLLVAVLRNGSLHFESCFLTFKIVFLEQPFIRIFISDKRCNLVTNRAQTTNEVEHFPYAS